MIVLSTKKYRNVSYKILRDKAGTGFKLDNTRAAWLDSDSAGEAEKAAKAAIDKRLGL